MSRESLVAALEEWAGATISPDDFGDYLLQPFTIADHAEALLPILLAHASPEARAAALRGLLGERLEAIRKAQAPDFDAGRDATFLDLECVYDLHREGRTILNLLAPTPPTGGTAE